MIIVNKDNNDAYNLAHVTNIYISSDGNSIKCAAGLHKVLTVHVFRRTLATRLADKECPLDVIQELLGHRSPATTKRYVAKNVTRIRRQAVRYMNAA